MIDFVTKKYKFSLIIATYNRSEMLKKCLDNLKKQEYTDFEVIVVDQSCEPIDISCLELPYDLKYVHIHEIGLSHARNIGLKYISGDYVCLVDDDGLYTPHVLEQANCIIVNEKPVILAGNLEDPITGIKRVEGGSRIITWKNAFVLSVSPSMIINADFLKANLFDERLGVGTKHSAGEETDIIFAALKQNEKCLYSDSYVTIHPVEKGKNLNYERTYKYAYGLGGLYRKIYNKYNRWWGLYYLGRSVIGNILKGIGCFFRKDKCSFFMMKSKRYLEGFADFS